MADISDVIRRKAQQAIRVLAQQAHVRAAYLFGSHVDGTADQDSDIDIAAFIDEARQWDIRRRARAAVETQKQTGYEIELHIFPADLLDNPPSASFAAYVQHHGVRIPQEGA
jgi:predicted nucleotidyltransferase